MSETDLSYQSRKEVNKMRKQYEAPELTLIGQAEEVVLGAGNPGDDMGLDLGWDFEFEQD
jgi:hypothetical protein